MPARKFIVQLTIESGEPTSDDLRQLRKIKKALKRAAFRIDQGDVKKCSVAPGQMNVHMVFPTWGGDPAVHVPD